MEKNIETSINNLDEEILKSKINDFINSQKTKIEEEVKSKKENKEEEEINFSSINTDEKILISKTIDPHSDIPKIEQVLRIAAYSEFESYERYSQINKKFDDRNIFENLKISEAKHYAVLVKHLAEHEIEVPKNDATEHIKTPDNFIEACETSLAEEIKNVEMYGDLIDHVSNEHDIKDFLYRLQAASYNRHIPALREEIKKYYENSQENIEISTNEEEPDNTANKEKIAQEELMKKVSEYQGIITDVVNGKIDESTISKILSNTNLSLIGGLAIGGIAAAVASNMLKNNNKGE